MKRFLIAILALGIVIYGSIGAYMFVAQRSLQYVPDATRVAPADAGLPMMTEEELATSDGEKLVAWYVAAARPDRPTYLYLHGNARNLAAHSKRYAGLIADGSGLFAMSWRGYSGSTGSPTEAGLRIDARTAYDALAKRVAPDRIVILGESLGTTLAVMLASEVKSAALVLDSGFTSAADVGAARYPWLPVRFLMLDTYQADQAAPKVTVPVLQVHCKIDHTIPIEFDEALNKLFKTAGPLEVVDGDCHPVETPDFMPHLTTFIAKVLPAAS